MLLIEIGKLGVRVGRGLVMMRFLDMLRLIGL